MTIKDPKKAPYNAFIITPKGIARYPWLQKPDTQFHPEGVYSVDLVLSKEEAQPLIDALTPMVDGWFNSVYNQAKARTKSKLIKHYPWEDELDDETGEPTGNIIFSFKQKAKITRKSDGKVFEKHVLLFTRDGKPYTKDDPIYGGSVIQVSCETNPYSIPATGLTGLSLRMRAVMIHEFGSGGRSAEGYGFDVAKEEETATENVYNDDDNDEDSITGDF